MNPDFISQNGTRYNYTPHDDESNNIYRSDPSSDDTYIGSQEDDPALFVDHLANSYHLNPESRGELHAFFTIARNLPPTQLKIHLIQHASMLQNHQLLIDIKTLCASTKDTTDTVLKSLSTSTQLGSAQTAEIQAACKVLCYNGRRTDFDNDALKRDVMPHLKKNMATNGLSVFINSENKATQKLLGTAVGQALSYAKTYLRRSIDKSLPSGSNRGTGVTELATELAKKCLGSSDKAQAKHAIWCLIIRSFVRAHPGLRMKASRNEADDDAENFPAPANLLPQKRSHTGLTKASTSDGKLLEAFWREMARIWGEKNTQYGTDLKSEGWTAYINECVQKERMLHPDDPLALIVGEAGAAAAPGTALTPTNRLAGISDLAASAGGSPSRPPQTPADTRRRQAIPHPFGGPGVSMDTLLRTPTEFTFRSRPLSRNSGLRLAPLNLPASGIGHHHSSPSSGINGWS
ncbi:hypothetical protein B0H14DRAFT_2660584 [Mycena olivaceomarginata]|nr:hypothetical protein B0H14DRAFT_2660584 [Mycena olivaceomarginata]